MNKHWLLLVVTALFEVGWVAGLKHADAAWEWLLTAAAIALSFYGLMAASKALPVGTVYAVFTGIGAAGTVLGEAIFFGVPLQPGKLALIILLIVGIVGLKVTSGSPERKEAQR